MYDDHTWDDYDTATIPGVCKTTICSDFAEMGISRRHDDSPGVLHPYWQHTPVGPGNGDTIEEVFLNHNTSYETKVNYNSGSGKWSAVMKVGTNTVTAVLTNLTRGSYGYSAFCGAELFSDVRLVRHVQRPRDIVHAPNSATMNGRSPTVSVP